MRPPFLEFCLAGLLLLLPRSSRAEGLEIRPATRLGAGFALGSTYYYRSYPPPVELVREHPLSPMATAAIALNVQPVTLYFGLHTQPFFRYYFGSSGHVGAGPVLLGESGLELHLGPLALGMSGAAGITALVVGPHLRLRLARRPTWDHSVELRWAWLPSITNEVAVLYSPSHPWRKKQEE